MALTGIEIYKLLPKTNCKKCGFPTCLAFAMQLAQKKVELAKCPAISVNTFAYAQDFSLIGEDVKSGGQVSAKVRVLYQEITELDAVFELYQAWNEKAGRIQSQW